MLRVRSPHGAARDVDLGPGSGLHTRGPVSGGPVTPAPPIPSGRKGTHLKPTPVPRTRARGRTNGVRCELPMIHAGTVCGRYADHLGHCRSRWAMDNELPSANRRKQDRAR